METLQVNVKGWPEELVDTLKRYAEQLSTKFQGNGKSVNLAEWDLPKWPGIACLPPERLRREELYRDEPE